MQRRSGEIHREMHIEREGDALIEREREDTHTKNTKQSSELNRESEALLESCIVLQSLEIPSSKWYVLGKGFQTMGEQKNHSNCETAPNRTNPCGLVRFLLEWFGYSYKFSNHRLTVQFTVFRPQLRFKTEPNHIYN